MNCQQTCGLGVTLPISTQLNPRSKRPYNSLGMKTPGTGGSIPSIASPSLSKPAARPTGLDIGFPQSYEFLVSLSKSIAEPDRPRISASRHLRPHPWALGHSSALAQQTCGLSPGQESTSKVVSRHSDVLQSASRSSIPRRDLLKWRRRLHTGPYERVIAG